MLKETENTLARCLFCKRMYTIISKTTLNLLNHTPKHLDQINSVEDKKMFKERASK